MSLIICTHTKLVYTVHLCIGQDESAAVPSVQSGQGCQGPAEDA